VIRDERPSVVTLNEICRNDMPALVRAMSATDHTKTLSAFRAALDRRTGRRFLCRNGQPYGVGLLARPRSSMSRQHTYSGRYRIQDLTDPEERVWLCIHAVSEFYACTTHTASTSTGVALAQCRSFMTIVVKLLADPVIIGADLNLPARRSPGPQGCVPRGYHRADDGSRQDVITSPQYPVAFRSDIDMNGATDHPGLLVELGRPPEPGWPGSPTRR
jgi:hypothetical protein